MSDVMAEMLAVFTSHISYLKFFILLLFIILSSSLFSQDLVESPLSTNQVLVKKMDRQKSGSGFRSASINDTINLAPIKGIVDDFSYDGPYPDTSIWLDNH